jgi:hypothetical protein
VTNGDEPETPPAAVHLVDPSVLDSEGKCDLVDTEETNFRRMCMCNIFDTTRDAPWKPCKFQDDKNRHITVNVIETLLFATEEPTVPDTFDPKLIRTSFDNLCKASYPMCEASYPMKAIPLKTTPLETLETLERLAQKGVVKHNPVVHAFVCVIEGELQSTIMCALSIAYLSSVPKPMSVQARLYARLKGSCALC